VLIISCLASVAVSAWSIPAHGLDGAAEAILAAGLVQLAGMGTILWKIDRQLRGVPPDLPLSEESRPEVAVC
jgi:hypothetical protein